MGSLSDVTRQIAHHVARHPRQRQYTGLELAKQIDVPAGLVYAALRLMADEGWFEAEWQTRQGVSRQVYRLTNVGFTVLGDLADGPIPRQD